MAVSWPERSTDPGSAPVGVLSTTVSTPFTKHPHDPVGAGGEPGGTARQVVHQGGVLGTDRRRVEDDDVGVVALREPTAVAKSEQLCRLVGQHLHGAFERAPACDRAGSRR